MFFFQFHTVCRKNWPKQECILIGCVLPVAVPGGGGGCPSANMPEDQYQKAKATYDRRPLMPKG